VQPYALRPTTQGNTLRRMTGTEGLTGRSRAGGRLQRTLQRRVIVPHERSSSSEMRLRGAVNQYESKLSLQLSSAATRVVAQVRPRIGPVSSRKFSSLQSVLAR
jgi:hypothetical protein